MNTESTEAPTLGRILVADDEPHIRRVLAVILEKSGYHVVQATDGTDALGYVDGPEPFDVILLDLMMPGASGIEILARVRGHQARARTPVIILTAKGQETDRQAALAGGADDFMTKPFSPKKLLTRIQEILAER